MKKIGSILLLISLFAEEGFAYCSYQDCGEAVNSSKMQLSNKISTTLEETNSKISDIGDSYGQHLKELQKQNEQITKLQTLSEKNNMALRELSAQQEKLSSLLSTGNKLSAKKTEILQKQNETLGSINKLKAEDK